MGEAAKRPLEVKIGETEDGNVEEECNMFNFILFFKWPM